MCDFNEVQNRRAMIVMLRGPSRAYYTRHVSSAITWEDEVGLLQKRYNNREKRCSILNEWQELRLTSAIRDDQTDSEADVFQAFI